MGALQNLFDVGHLVAVHHYEEPDMKRPTTDGTAIRGGSRVTVATTFGPFTRRVRVDLNTELHGLGIALFDSSSEPGGLSFRGAFTWNPIGPAQVDFRLSVWVKTLDSGLATMPIFRWLPRRAQNDLMGRLLVSSMMRDIGQDKDVLERKRHLPRPGYSDGDASIAVYRRWTKQFYPDAQV